MAVAKFLSGTKEQLNKKNLEDGCIYFITDTNEIYVDIPNGERLLFSSNLADFDILYELIKEKFLTDPDAIFQGAGNGDGTSGLLPAPGIDWEQF